jgi:hypothetical protein
MEAKMGEEVVKEEVKMGEEVEVNVMCSDVGA